MSITQNKEIKYETPLVFLDLIEKREKTPQKIEIAIENLKKMKEKTDRLAEELKEGYKQEQKGFLYYLYNALLVERKKAEGIENKFFHRAKIGNK